MAHLLENMAFVGTTPWHGLGNQLPPKQPLEVWATKAGMDWSIRETPVCYRTNGIDRDHGVMTFDEQPTCLVGPLPRLGQADVRVGAQAEIVALAVQAVREAPPMRFAIHEQQQEQPVAIVQALARVARLDRLDRLV